jgi:signal transduction histidine kinase
LNTLKTKIIAFFLITAFLIFSILAVLILKMERQDRIEDMTALLYHISSEIMEENLDLSNPLADLSYLQGIDNIRTLTANKAISNPHFEIVSNPLEHKNLIDRIAVMSKLPNGYFFVASSDTHLIDKSLGHLTVELYLSFIGALSLLTLLFYLVLRKLLSPMEELVRACDTIDLEGRPTHFPLSSASIEIQRLGSALQSLVDKVAFFRDKEREMFKEAAHQIKTPMAILKARLDQYSLDSTADKEKFLLQANGDIAKLLKYLKELLLVQQSQVSQDESGELIDMAHLIADITAYAAPLLHRKQQSIILETESTFSIITYRHSLTKLILTILENCINHAPINSSITIILSSKDSKVTFGNRIATDESPALFNSNLGLKIIRELSASLNMSVTVDNQKDIFLLSLNLK